MLFKKNNIRDRNDTTIPKRVKRKDKSDLGENFVAPDGGWGWIVCLAAGFSNLSIFPPLQQYGLIYRQRMLSLGFDAKQTTTIVNIIMAISSLVGIVNGAMFRRFSFRQVAITGSLLIFMGILSSAFCTTFWQYIISFSCIYGIGLGLCMAATSLAVNTYFKDRRRRATGFSWTLTGLGPIIFPHVSTFLLIYYGAQGTILLYAGFTLNAVLCGMTLQPVLWHVQRQSSTEKNALTEPTEIHNEEIASMYECQYCKHKKRNKRHLLSSQYLFNDDDEDTPGYEITEPGTPMLARANDGWFGSRLSLNSDRNPRLRHKVLRQTSQKYVEGIEIEKNNEQSGSSNLFKPNYFNREHQEIEHYASKSSVYLKPGVHEGSQCTCAEDQMALQKLSDNEYALQRIKFKAEQEAEANAKSKLSLKEKIVKFFDLDLLKDFTFVNLALGMTIMMFGEMNFSVLTPFILSSYGYKNEQISLAMSLLGAMDISVRFLAPFALEKIKLGNQLLFSFGILAITIGRLIVTITDSFNMILVVFLLIGFGKGFRTIFSPLIIPSYVPLNRLPAASGLQLIFNTIFSCAFGPLLGIITDATNYTVTIHFINCFTCFALLMWTVESLIRHKKQKNVNKINMVEETQI